MFLALGVINVILGATMITFASVDIFTLPGINKNTNTLEKVSPTRPLVLTTMGVFIIIAGLCTMTM